MAAPRTVGLMPRQRLAPALPSFWRLCSTLPTSPMVARHSAGTRRISPERRRSVAYTPSRATSCTPAPAARAICAPLPGFISMQCTVEPTGMLRSGRSEEHPPELHSLTRISYDIYLSTLLLHVL